VDALFVHESLGCVEDNGSGIASVMPRFFHSPDMQVNYDSTIKAERNWRSKNEHICKSMDAALGNPPWPTFA
jgi:hypothetical protein